MMAAEPVTCDLPALYAPVLAGLILGLIFVVLMRWGVDALVRWAERRARLARRREHAARHGQQGGDDG